jgi:hypothetical protein
MFFLNGEAASVPASVRTALRRLADERRLEAGFEAPAELWDVVYGWYRQGFVKAGEAG